MNRSLMPKMKSDKGFTLVELLVVIIIIGILAAVAIPAFLNQRQRANDATVKSDIKNVATQVETLIADNPQGPIYKSGSDLAVTGSTLTATVKTSPGVTWDIYGSSSGYCVEAWHDNGKSFKSTSPLYYDSSTGGMKPVGQSCGTIPNAPNGTPISGGGGAAEPTHYAWAGTPNLSASTATAQSGPVRTNLVANPSFETSATGWFGTIRDTNAPISGNASGLLTNNPDCWWSSFTVVAGETYTLSIDYTTVGTLTNTPILGIQMPNGTWITQALNKTQPTSTRGVVTGVMATSGTAYVRVTNGRGNIADIMHFDNVLLEKSATAGKYFDGYTTSTF